MITQERLKQVLHYNKATGLFHWKISNQKAVKGAVAGYKHDGYIQIGVDGGQYRAHRLAWLYVEGYFPETGIDHEDRIRHHNWWLNLREVTQQCNLRNTGNRKNNKSGVKGVSWLIRDSKWRASIGVSGKCYNLGHFVELCDAVKARYAKEVELDWVGCEDTSPAYLYLKEHHKLGVK